MLGKTEGKTNTIGVIPHMHQPPKQLGLSNEERLLGLGFPGWMTFGITDKSIDTRNDHQEIV
jgi:hypothetical protein